MLNFKNEKGFTLLELIIALAIFLVIFSFSSMALNGRQQKAGLELASSELMGVLRLARSNSMSGLENTTWGVYLSESSSSVFTLYKGSSYALRDVSYDRVMDMGAAVTYTLQGERDINFSSLDGSFAQTAEISVGHRGVIKQVVININNIGKIDRNG